jgi:hypothetical protein
VAGRDVYEKKSLEIYVHHVYGNGDKSDVHVKITGTTTYHANFES